VKLNREFSMGDGRTTITPASLAAALTRPTIVTVLWLAAALEICNVLVKLPQHATRLDFSIYYLSAMALRQGRNPYAADFESTGKRLGLWVGGIRHATDPPTFLLLTEPLALMPEREAFYVWSVLNAVLLAAALVLLLGRPGGRRRKEMLALAALALLYPAVEMHFLSGQSKIPLLLLLAAMIRLMERDWDWAAGLCLALAGLLRIFPLLLVGYLAIQRRWRVLGWTMIGIVLGVFATCAIFGIRNSLSFLSGAQLLTEGQWLAEWGNISVRGAVSRLIWFAAGAHGGATIEILRQSIVLATDAILLGLTAVATFRLKPRKDPDWRALTMWIVASVLLSPTAWIHYAVLFLIPFAQLSVAGRVRASVRAQWMAALSYIVMLLTTRFAMLSVDWVDVHMGRSWSVWLVAAMGEAWFVSAMLMYFASYWFTVDGVAPTGETVHGADGGIATTRIAGAAP
jgi:Glycosyltransferase family 87